MISTTLSPQEVLFNRYQHLAVAASKKIDKNTLNLLQLSIEDIEQELLIKVFTSIENYTLKEQVVTLEIYIRSALNNRVLDFQRSAQTRKKHQSVELSRIDISISEHQEFISFSTKEEDFAVKLQGQEVSLSSKEQNKIATLWLKGYKETEIRKMLQLSKTTVQESISCFIEKARQIICNEELDFSSQEIKIQFLASNN